MSMSQAAQLTVIVPAFNASNTIERCLNSIVNQSLKNIQIIVVDDCSTDNTYDIVKQFQTKYNNIKIEKFEKNMDVGYGRNYALNLVNTDYVTFVDSDDWVDTNAYKNCMQRLTEEQSDVAVFGIKNEFDNKVLSQIRYEYADNYISGAFALNLLCNVFALDISLSPIVNNKIYSTKLLKEHNIQFGDMHYYEDMVFSFNVMQHAKTVSLVSNTYYHYYQNPASKLHNISSNQLDCFCESLKQIYDIINHDDKKVMELFFSFLDKSVCALVGRIDDFVASSHDKKQLLVHLFTELTKVVPMNKFIEYIDIRRIINAIRLTY